MWMTFGDYCIGRPKLEDGLDVAMVFVEVEQRCQWLETPPSIYSEKAILEIPSRFKQTDHRHVFPGFC
jgi:hypothetical protein